ncbi:unnamed protein product [Callosobruchus maculatus]|uniref:Uncharacterized protein n=1 Tax=Callosobruchus maculatus TaxID=64391 RepID=A0A653CHU9_CALMS|nr:unnamed protein product [Callosobruchus maculatus]
MALGQFCDCLKNCADKLEEDIRTNINEFHNMVTEGAVDEVKLALDKAKDYHYKEIVRFMEDIVNDVRKIVLHEHEIQRLQRQERMTEDERKRHSYVRRQIRAFNGSTKVTRREIRRAASEQSINSLEAWENYLDRKGETGLSTSLPELTFPPVQRRQTGKSRRNQKNRSSTFNSILDSSSVASQNLGNISEEDKVEEQADDSSVAEYSDSMGGGSRVKLDSETSWREEDSQSNERLWVSASEQSEDFNGVERVSLKDTGHSFDQDRYQSTSNNKQSTSQTDGCETQGEQLNNDNNSNNKTDFEENFWSDSECDNESNSASETEVEDFPVIKLIKSLSDVVDSGDTRPKIIDVVYKHDVSSKDPDGTG